MGAGRRRADRESPPARLPSHPHRPPAVAQTPAPPAPVTAAPPPSPLAAQTVLSRYIGEIREIVDAHLTVPQQLIDAGLEGDCVLAFTLAPDGTILSAGILTPSGLHSVNAAALAALRASALPPFPLAMGTAPHNFTLPIHVSAHGLRDPGARRIVNLRHNGQKVAKDQKFAVVTINYRADTIAPGAILVAVPDQTRDVIIRYILRSRTFSIAPPPVWSFLPPPNPVILTFASSPAAAPYLLARPGITRLADRGDGYALFALRLDEI